MPNGPGPVRTSRRIGRPRATRLAIGSLLTTLVAFPAMLAVPRPAPVSADEVETVIAAAGDIACQPGMSRTTVRCQQAATAQLISSINPDAVLALGDNQYENGTLNEYQGAYRLSWGAFKDKTFPVAGNHEYATAGAAGYFDYFGPVAGDRTKGYYSFDLGSWHLVALNSECTQIGGCHAGSPQEQWLRSDLAASTAPCTLAFWHRPRFGSAGGDTSLSPLWRALYDFNAELALVGHGHYYERFAPQTSGGTLDLSRGIREILVGVGGRSFHSVGTPIRNSEVRNNNTFGILKVTLKSSSYDWQFVPAAIPGGGTFTDAGSGACHGPGGAPDTTPPTVPTNLRVTGSSSNQVSLAWNASTDNVGVTGYRVYRDGGQIAATGTTPSHVDTSVAPGTTYAYEVSAIDAAGNESARSAAVTVTTPASGGTFTFAPTDDAYVRLSQPNSTFNFAQLTADADPVDDFLVRFDVATACTAFDTARLQLTNVDGSPTGGTIRLAATTPWREATVTWSNAPAAGTALATLGSVTPGVTYTADVSAAVSANGPVTFRVSSSSTNGARYNSKEGSATQGPRLVVTCT